MIASLLFWAVAGEAISTQTTILAVCGASSGISRFIEPRDTGWTKDAITGGTITFIQAADGKPDIITKDAMGKTQAVSQFSLVLAPMTDPATGTLLFVTVDRDRNEALTYNVTTDASGKRTLLWTDSKIRKTRAGITKVAMFSAPCEDQAR